MDLFSRELGTQYVPAFAGRLLLSMAKGIASAPSDTKRAFLEKDADSLWTLAVIVVQWYADRLPPSESSAVAATLREFDIASVASNLNLFRDRLVPFVKTAHEARSEAQLAAAGVYFLATVEQIGMSLLSSAMNSGAVSALGRKLKARLPLPDEVKAGYYRVLGAQPSGTTTRPVAPDSPSRGDRFERADFSPRSAQPGRPTPPGRGAPGPEKQGQAKAGIARTASPPPDAPTPNLADTEVARAYLYTLGWEGNEVDRLLQGPKPAGTKSRG